MKNAKKLFCSLLIVTIFMISPVSATNTFQYALTQNELPSGFVLESNSGSAFVSKQSWKTPSDSTGKTQFNVNEYNTTSDVNSWWSIDAGIYSGHKMSSFQGADKAVNATTYASGGTYYMYYVEIGLFIIQTYLFTNTFNKGTYLNEKILIEAQITKITAPNSTSQSTSSLTSQTSSAQGFTSLIFLFSFSFIGIVFLRKKKRNI